MTIELLEVSDGQSPPVSLRVGDGISAVLRTASDAETDVLLAMISGLLEPVSGRVLVGGEDMYDLSEARRLRLFRKIGIVRRDGGIISNLKVWENILFPASYHGITDASRAEPVVRQYYNMMGIQALEEIMASGPGKMALHDRVLVAVIRTVLMEPDLIVYDSVLEGADPSWGGRLVKMLLHIHRARQGRTSLFITSSSAEADLIEADVRMDTRQVR